MKKNVFLLVILTTAMMISCDKNLQQNSNNPIDVRTDDPNYIEFEYNLNKTFVSNPGYIQLANTHLIPFTHTNGFITATEKNRITNAIQTLITSGINPKLIDVNLSKNDVEVIESNYVVEPEWGPLQVHPDGELGVNGLIIPGTFCTGSPDAFGGTIGRVGLRFYKNHINDGSFPAEIYNIIDLEIRGACGSFCNFFGFDLLCIKEDLHHLIFSCPSNQPNCLDLDLLNLNYTALVDVKTNNLPTGTKIIGIRNARNLIGNNISQNFYGFKLAFVGTPQ